MIRISSKLTYLFKHAFPVLWFGSLVVCFCIGLAMALLQKRLEETTIVMLAAPPIMSIFGYFSMKFLLFDLVDEVWDSGDSLIIRNNGQEVRVSLLDCVNVNYNAMMSTPRVTLLLHQPTIFGGEISFIPPFRWIPHFMPPIAKELIYRIDAAKRSTAGSEPTGQE